MHRIIMYHFDRFRELSRNIIFSIKSTIIDMVMYAFLQLHQVVKHSLQSNVFFCCENLQHLRSRGYNGIGNVDQQEVMGQPYLGPADQKKPSVGGVGTMVACSKS